MLVILKYQINSKDRVDDFSVYRNDGFLVWMRTKNIFCVEKYYRSNLIQKASKDDSSV